MANSNNRTCHVCGASYRFCPSCAEFEGWEYWHVMFHNKNCHDIWYALSDFEDGKITREEAKEILSKLDTSKIVNKHVIESYNKLYEINKVVEEPSTEEVVEEKKIDAVEAAMIQLDKALAAEEDAHVEEPKHAIEQPKKNQQKNQNKNKK